MGASCTGVYGSKYAEYYLIIHVSHKYVLILNQAGKEREMGRESESKVTVQRKAGKDSAESQLSL